VHVCVRPSFAFLTSYRSTGKDLRVGRTAPSYDCPKAGAAIVNKVMIPATTS